VKRNVLSNEERQDPDTIAVVAVLCKMTRGGKKKYLTLVPFPSNWDYPQHLLPWMSQGLESPGPEPFVSGLSPLVPSFESIAKGIFCSSNSIVRFGATAGKCTCIVKFDCEDGEFRYGAPLGGPIEGVVTLRRLLTYKQFQSEFPEVTPFAKK